MSTLRRWLAGTAVAAAAAAFTPPVPVMRVTSFFGESRHDHFHNGVDFAGDGLPVRAVLPGTVLFWRDEANEPWAQPLGYGNYIILLHGDRYRSHYYHLAPGSLPQGLVAVAEGHIIGKTGNSGHSAGPHLHFTLVDLQERKIVNPLAFLPEFVDSLSPVIGGVYISRQPKPSYGSARLEPLSPTTPLTQGRNVWLFVQAWDRVQTSALRAGVHRLEVTLDGRPLRSLRFDSLDLVPPAGSLLGTRLSFFEVFGGPYLYRVGELTVPEHGAKLSVKVWDYHGNRAESEILLSEPLGKK